MAFLRGGIMRIRFQWTTLVVVGLSGVLLLAACGSILGGAEDGDAVALQPTPIAPEARTEEEPAPVATVQEKAEAAATLEAESTAPAAAPAPTATDAGDDRPAGLKAVTGSWNTNWDLHSIDYDELLSGGPPRDGIPSIDAPQLVSGSEAAEWLADNEPVIALEINGVARAYPLQILTWHEIVNDTVGDVPVIVTFCPLCNSAITFDRRLEGEVYEFGTSGLLRKSDLVMYDRTTESLWQQFTGEAIVGDMVGQRLTFLPSSIVSFADFREAYPEGRVLSRDTGYSRSYGRNPYAGYDTIGESPFLFDGDLDGRLPAMERVVSVELGEVDVAYPLSILSEAGVIHDSQAGRDLVVFHTPGTSSALGNSVIANGEDVGATGVFDPVLHGQKLTFETAGDAIVDQETGSTWNVLGQAINGPLAGDSLTPVVHGDHFWFAWAAFKPDTIVYQDG
jgi:hypothetical protein